MNIMNFHFKININKILENRLNNKFVSGKIFYYLILYYNFKFF